MTNAGRIIRFLSPTLFFAISETVRTPVLMDDKVDFLKESAAAKLERTRKIHGRPTLSGRSWAGGTSPSIGIFL